MKIAFVDIILDPARPGASGLSDVVWSMAHELAALGDDVHIVAPYAMEVRHQPGITVHRFALPPIGYRNIVGHLLIVLCAWRELRRLEGLHVIVAPEYLSTGVIAPWSSLPVVLVTPGNIYERIANGNPFDWYTTQVYRVAARLSARHCAFVDAISQDMAEWWVRTGTPRARIAVIPYGVDTSLFYPIPKARSLLDLPLEAAIVLYVGRLSPEKHVEVLIQAVAAASSQVPGLELHVVGNGPQLPALKHLAQALDARPNVFFHGEMARAQMPRWYSAADICVLPSSSEGLPRVMLEAWACRAAFIGMQISGIRDHLQDGSNGYTLSQLDQSILARLLQDAFLNHDRLEAVRTSGFDYVQARLTWGAAALRFRSAVETCIGPSRQSISPSPRM